MNLMDNEIENSDSLNAEMDVEKELEEILNSPDEASKLQETNKRLFVRAKKAEEELKAIKAQKQVVKQEEDINNNQQNYSPENLYENLFEVKNLEKDEFLTLSSEAKSLGVDPLRYMKSNAGKVHLEAIRKEAKSKDASNETPSVSRVFQKFTQDDLNGMSSAELEKILPKAE